MFSNYCGFGGSGRIRHKTDELCSKHDAMYAYYSKQGRNPYFHYNKADKWFLGELAELEPAHMGENLTNWFAQRLFEFKSWVAKAQHTEKVMEEKKMLEKIASDYDAEKHADIDVVDFVNDKYSQSEEGPPKKIPKLGGDIDNMPEERVLRRIRPVGNDGQQAKTSADGKGAKKSSQSNLSDKEQDDFESPPNSGTLKKTPPTIKPMPKDKDKKDESDEKMEDDPAYTQPSAALMSSSRSAGQRRGQETQITPIPKVVPDKLPETCNFRHRMRKRTTLTATSDEFNDSFDGFRVLIRLQDPVGGVTVGSSIAAEDGGNSPTTYAGTGNLSYYDYMKQRYDYYTVTHTKVFLHYTDLGFFGSGGVPVDDSTIPRQFKRDLPYLLWRDYGLDRPTAATMAAKSGITMSEDPMIAKRQFKRTSESEYKHFLLEDQTSGTAATKLENRFSECVLKQNYTHASYERLMDVHGDTQDTIWVASGSQPTLTHDLFVYHRYWDGESAAVNLSANVSYGVRIDMEIEYTIQWKQLHEDYLFSTYAAHA